MRVALIASDKSEVRTSVGDLPTNAFGFAFLYNPPETAMMVEGRLVECPKAGHFHLDASTGKTSRLTAIQRQYVEFRELSHEEKVRALDENPRLARFVVCERTKGL